MTQMGSGLTQSTRGPHFPARSDTNRLDFGAKLLKGGPGPVKNEAPLTPLKGNRHLGFTHQSCLERQTLRIVLGKAFNVKNPFNPNPNFQNSTYPTPFKALPPNSTNRLTQPK